MILPCMEESNPWWIRFSLLCYIKGASSQVSTLSFETRHSRYFISSEQFPYPFRQRITIGDHNHTIDTPGLISDQLIIDHLRRYFILFYFILLCWFILSNTEVAEPHYSTHSKDSVSYILTTIQFLSR